MTISGSGFSDTPGEVHFIVANQRDLVAPVTYWSATQILTEVPYIDGVRSYPGGLYVKRVDGAQTSPPMPFRFDPPLDVALMGISYGDNRLSNEGARRTNGNGTLSILQRGEIPCFGVRGDDEFYVRTQLKNGWYVESIEPVGALWALPLNIAPIGPSIWGRADAYVVDHRIGTASPYVKVHYWADGSYCFAQGYNAVDYGLRITIRGPKGLAYN